MKEIAVVMAAGLGTRMRPLTEKKPKPLVKVCGKPMIETIIEGLESRKIGHIYIVAGYMGEQFQYLIEKYGNVSIVPNAEYQLTNNISSMFMVSKVLEDAAVNCFICEADLYVMDKAIFKADLSGSCYYGKLVQGHSDDWVFEQDENGRITRIGKGGDDLYNMVGIAYFVRDDVRFLAEVIKTAYADPNNRRMFWDEIVNQHLDEINLTIHPVNECQLIEIDTVEELVRIDKQLRGRFHF